MKVNVTAARDLSCLLFSAGLSQTIQLSVTTMTAILTLSECDSGRSECDDGRSECDDGRCDCEGGSKCDGGRSKCDGGRSVMVGVNVLVEDVTVMVGGVSGDVADVYNVLCLPVPRFGMHEDYDYYVNCKLRQRNMGLFTADQVGGNSLSGGCHMWA